MKFGTLNADVLGQEQETVLADRRVERRVLLLPVGNKLVQRARIHDGAGEDVRADLRAFFQHAYADFTVRRRGKLLQTYRGGESRRSGADHDHVIFHYFALRHFVPSKDVCRHYRARHHIMRPEGVTDAA